MRLSIKFNPAFRRQLAPDDRRLWLLRCVALRIEQHTNPLWRFEVYHRRLLVTGLLLGVAGYVAATSALWFWLDRNPHNQARWADVVQLPWKWDEVRRQRGDTAIATAKERLRARDYVEAFHYLRTGLGRSPGNVEGRLLLAQLVAGYEPHRALSLLEDGIPHAAADPRFLGGLFAFYAQFQVQRHALAQIDRLRADLRVIAREEPRALLGRTRAYLLAGEGRWDEAAAELDAAPPGPLTAVARADLMLRAGRPAEARAALVDLQPEARLRLPEIARRETEIAVALNDADGLQSALRRWRAHAPDQPAPYLHGYVCWHRLNRASFRDAAEREYYGLFGRNDGAMQSFAALAVNLDLPDVVERARQVAVANRASAFAYHVHLTEIALRRGRFEEAVRHLRGWEKVVETLQPAQRFYPEFIRRLARAAFLGGDVQADTLVAHLTSHRGQAQLPVWLLAVRILGKAGQPSAVQKLLRPARILYPHTDELATLQAQVELAVPAASAAIGPDVLPAIAPTAAEALDRFDELLRAEALAAARDQLRAIRAARPDWLAASEAAVARREIQLAFGTLDPLTSRSLVRQYLGRHRAPADMISLIEVARGLKARQQSADARTIAEEVTGATDDLSVREAIAGLHLPDDLAGPLAGAPEAWAALDRWISAGQWTQAERLLNALRQRAPAWLAAEQTGIKVREVQVRLGLEQRPAALTALKEIVIKPGAPRSASFKLVRDYIAAGDQETAISLAREIVRLLPADAAAAKLLQEARTPRPL